MNIEDLRSYCLTQPGVTEDIKWGNDLCFCIFPASMTLFGDGPADSKTLVLQAIRKYGPVLFEKYEKLFKGGFQVPYEYSKELEKRTTALSAQYGFKNSLF